MVVLGFDKRSPVAHGQWSDWAYAAPCQPVLSWRKFADTDATTPWRNEPIRAGFMVGWKKYPSSSNVRVGSKPDSQRLAHLRLLLGVKRT